MERGSGIGAGRPKSGYPRRLGILCSASPISLDAVDFACPCAGAHVLSISSWKGWQSHCLHFWDVDWIESRRGAYNFRAFHGVRDFCP